MKNFILLFSISIFAGSIAESAVYKMTPERGRVTFLAKGKPALISIKGEGEGVSSRLTELNGRLSGDIQFNLASLKTGIELRDDHLKNKYLEVNKHPTAVLKIDGLQLPESFINPFPFTGVLRIRSAEQTVNGTVRITDQSGSQNLIAEFKIQLSEFKIEIPSFQGITVAEEVSLLIDVPFEREI